MGLFGRSSNETYGALIDIGSGSVLASVIASDPAKDQPEIIWSKREYTPLRQNNSLKDSSKSVLTSLLNVLMLLNKDGKQALYKSRKTQKLDEIQVTISAPWSYTITKSVSFNNDDGFVVTGDLVSELLRTAHTKVTEELKENEKMHDLGLSVMSRNLMSVIANGYNLKTVNSQTAKTLKLVEANAVAQAHLKDNVAEILNKILPNQMATYYSFILVFYELLRTQGMSQEDCGLLDITYEATEVGIIREGTLTYCTHIPYGAASLAREISAILNVPLEEAFAFIKEPSLEDWLSAFSPAKQTEIRDLFNIYRDKLTAAFRETGDTLAIPKRIYIHGNLGSDKLYQNLVREAAESATLLSHTIYSINESQLLKPLSEVATATNRVAPTPDPTLLITAQFFHMRELRARFEQT